MEFSKKMATIASVLFLTVLLVPVRENWRAKPQDSFPLSYYPMFSKKRAEIYSMYYFVGYDSLHNRYDIPYKLIGTGGFNQVRRQLQKSARQGKGEQLAKEVIQNLVGKKDGHFAKITEIRLVKGSYHLENYFLEKETMPRCEKILVSQKIER